MKRILLIFIICLSFKGIAQDLESIIPSNAEAVVSIDGNRVLELISMSEFDDSFIAKELLKQANKNRDTEIMSINQLGLNLNSKAYYFYKKTDSVGYHNFLIKLKNRNSFESNLKKSDIEKIQRIAGLNISEDGSNVAMWNDNILLMTAGDASYGYFKDNEERFSKQATTEDEQYYTTKKNIVKGWVGNFAKNVFKGNSASIISNKSYLASKDKKASASIWIRNYGELVGKMMSNMYGMAGMNSLAGFNTAGGLNGFKSVVGNLYFEEDGARMTTAMEVDSEWQKTFKKIYKSKFDKKFFKYFNQNDALAYMSFSMNMQATFEEYPTFMTNIYGGMMPNFKEEMELSGEFLSLLLDEKAIGELMTGTMLFVLNDMSEKEMEYTTYEYDEDYNRKEVTKTKKEMSPDFTIMIGSEKGGLLNKAARLGVKHKVFESKAGYFKIDAPKKDIPFDLFTAVKNDILFFTTSEKVMADIVNNRSVSNLGKHQKLIRNNISTMYINGQQLFSKVPTDNLSKDEQKFFGLAQENFKDAYFKSSKMKGNKVLSEMKVNTDTSKGNSLKLLLNLIEAVAK